MNKNPRGYRGTRVVKQERPIDRWTMRDYLGLAYYYAENLSTDPSTKNGAILIDEDGNVRASGANHFPGGVVESAERWNPPLKYQIVEHAERNVIYAAAREGVATKGLTMVCPWFACPDCGRAIIQAGIKKVVGHKQMADFGQSVNPKWYDGIALSLQMFREAGVAFEWYDGKIGPTEIIKLKDGTLYTPRIIVGKQNFEP